MWQVEPGHLGLTPDFAVALGKITLPAHAHVILAKAVQTLTVSEVSRNHF